MTEKPAAMPAPFALRYRLWRNRVIASARFRGALARFPLTRFLANRKANALFRLTAGFVHSQVLLACVRLGLLERLAQAPMTTSELAAATALPLSRMSMLLEGARDLGLVTEAGPDLWVLDDAGAVMAADRGLIALVDHHAQLYADLQDPVALLRGKGEATRMHRYWAYVRGGQESGLTADDVDAYSDLMRESQAMLADCILSAHDFRKYRTVLDIGGGDGAFLAAAGARHPHLRLMLFDLPAVAGRARAFLSRQGLTGRAKATGGDFTRDPLPGDADCVTLVRILCDHDDDVASRILANLHRSLKPGTQVIVAEAMAGPSEGARLAASYFNFYFLAMGSGRCRSARQIACLLSAAGFRNTAAKATANPLLATLVLAEK